MVLSNCPIGESDREERADRHSHSAIDPPGEPHSHPHRHEPMVHTHDNYPDIHHRHDHK